VVFLLIMSYFIFYMPNSLGHPDNYIAANSLVTPAHIVPEWYYLPFYAILRAVTFDISIPFTDIVLINSKLGGVIAMFGSLLIFFVVPWLDTSKIRSAAYRPLFKQFFWIFVVVCLALGYLGSRPAEGLYTTFSQIFTFWYFFHFIVILPVLGLIEKPKPIPASITEAVLAKSGNSDS